MARTPERVALPRRALPPMDCQPCRQTARSRWSRATSSGGGATAAAPPAAPGAGRAGLLEDVMYAWMLAEAYLEHPLLHSDMR